MTIEHSENGRQGVFFIGNQEKPNAEMTYIWAGSNKIIVDHTEVNKDLQGKGVGRQLLDELVKFVRERGIKVLPLCPFAKAQFEKLPQYSDVLF